MKIESSSRTHPDLSPIDVGFARYNSLHLELPSHQDQVQPFPCRRRAGNSGSSRCRALRDDTHLRPFRTSQQGSRVVWGQPLALVPADAHQQVTGLPIDSSYELDDRVVQGMTDGQELSRVVARTFTSLTSEVTKTRAFDKQRHLETGVGSWGPAFDAHNDREVSILVER